MKVLIADDEELIRYDLHSTLEEIIEDAEIYEAVNSRELISLAREHEPTLTFVDIKMPGISGLEAIEILNSLQVKSHFILMSGFAEFDYAKKAIQLGVLDYLLKPVNPNEILRLISKYVPCKDSTVDEFEPESSHHDVEKKQKSLVVVNQAMEIIKEKFQDSIGVAQVAEMLGITPNYLSSQFKKWKSISFTDYITNLRMIKAQELLLISGARVKEVSKQLGYSSSKYFTKLFRSKYGVSPSYFMCSQDESGN